MSLKIIGNLDKPLSQEDFQEITKNLEDNSLIIIPSTLNYGQWMEIGAFLTDMQRNFGRIEDPMQIEDGFISTFNKLYDEKDTKQIEVVPYQFYNFTKVELVNLFQFGWKKNEKIIHIEFFVNGHIQEKENQDGKYIELLFFKECIPYIELILQNIHNREELYQKTVSIAKEMN